MISTLSPCMMLMKSVLLLKSFFQRILGFRFMTSFSSGSASKTTGACRIYDEFHEHDMHRHQDQWPLEKDRYEGKPGDWNMDRENIGNGFFYIVENPPAKFHRLDDGGEIIVQEDQRCGFPGHISTASAHGDADVCGFQCRCVIHAIACHRDYFPVGLERIHYPELLFGNDAGKDIYIPDFPLNSCSSIKSISGPVMMELP